MMVDVIVDGEGNDDNDDDDGRGYLSLDDLCEFK